MTRRLAKLAAVLLVVAILHTAAASVARGHEGHHAATYEVTPAHADVGQSTHLRLKIVDAQTGEPLAARFTLKVDGRAYVPPALSEHGLRFTSIHQGKKHVFLVLKGGNLPGIWAQQHAYGKEGEADDGRRLIRSGEEYRDRSQGHVNLLGVNRVIEPTSTGGIGDPSSPFNYPPLLDVFRETHERGGIGGPAHGGSLALSSTSALDTILGQTDFFEIANTHLYKTDAWYLLLNGGFIVPPVAGTDLPNFGFRDAWQPLLGEVRTYVRCGERHDFQAWKEAVRQGRTFITSGPIIELEVNGQGPGGIVRLPAGGGRVTIRASLTSPRPLESLELVHMGEPLAGLPDSTQNPDIHRLTIEHELMIESSCWIAARGTGGPKTVVNKALGIDQREIAHTGVIQILVGDQPIRSMAGITALRAQLVAQQEHYRTKANYEKPEHRLRFVNLFEQAIRMLDDVDRLVNPTDGKDGQQIDGAP